MVNYPMNLKIKTPITPIIAFNTSPNHYIISIYNYNEVVTKFLYHLIL
jgi:hypothetical protein